MEAAVSAAPDDPSEGDKLNLAIGIASASAGDVVLTGACSTLNTVRVPYQRGDCGVPR